MAFSSHHTGGHRMRIFRTLLIILLAILENAAPAAAQPSRGNGLALVGAKIYPSPEAAPIANGTVLIEKGKIVAVGKREQMKIPAGITVLDCHGMIITAGFQNSHVHFTELKW